MWFRRKTDSLAEPQRLSTADYLVKLMEEQNSLLRELLRAMGRQPSTIRALPTTGRRIYTDQDVFRIGKPNGRDSAPTASTSGPTPPSKDVAQEG